MAAQSHLTYTDSKDSLNASCGTKLCNILCRAIVRLSKLKVKRHFLLLRLHNSHSENTVRATRTRQRPQLVLLTGFMGRDGDTNPTL